MSYSIIFETKIIKMTDGAILHLDRSGCSNDSEGRKKGVFIPKLYGHEEFVKLARKFMEDSAPYKKEVGDWEMKIGSRYATCYDYGKHLLRMLKRAVSYTDFLSAWDVTIEHYTGIELIKPEHKVMSMQEFSGTYGLSYVGELRYFIITESLDIKDEAKVSQLIREEKPLEFFVRRAS